MKPIYHLKLYLSAIVALLCLVSCGNENEDQPDKNEENPYYMEELVYQGDQYIIPGVYDGRLAVVNRDYKVADIDSGEIIANIPLELMEQYQLGMYSHLMTLDPNGNIYMLHYGDNGPGIIVIYADPAQGYSYIPFAQWEGVVYPQSGNPAFLKARADGEYYYLKSQLDDVTSILQVFSLKGELVRTYKNICDFSLGGNGKGEIYITDGEKGNISKYALYSNELLYQTSCKQGDDWRVFAIGYEEQSDKLYVVMNENIYSYSGSDLSFIKVEMVRAESMEDLGEYVTFIETGDQGQIYSGEYQKIYRYTLSEKKNVEITDRITITAPYREEYIAKMINMYMKDNPDKEVIYDYEYSSYSQFATNVIADNYYDKINLRLLNGEVGDIFIRSDGMPYFRDQLMSDVFLDLNEKLKDSQITSELDKMALEGMDIDGQLKVIPLGINYYFAYVNTSLAEELGINIDWGAATWSDILDLHDRLEGSDCVLFSVTNKQRLLSRILISNMPDIIDYEDGKVNFDQDWFNDLLSEIEEVWDSPNFVKVVDSSPDVMLDEKTLINIDGLSNSVYIHDEISRYFRYTEKEGAECEIVPLFEGEQASNRTAGSSSCLSITSWSENTDAAWDFIEYICSEDVMERSGMKDRQLNTAVRDMQMKEALKHYPDEKAEEFSEDMQGVYSLVDCCFDMGDVKQTLCEALFEGLDNDQDLYEVLKETENAIWIRLNE